MYRKINIYLRNLKGFYVYECSTNMSKTCKQAKERFLEIHNYLDGGQVRASFK